MASDCDVRDLLQDHLARHRGIPAVVNESTGGLAGRRNDACICMGHAADRGDALGLCVQDLRLAVDEEHSPNPQLRVGAPRGILTHDLQLRRLSLYPSELWALGRFDDCMACNTQRQRRHPDKSRCAASASELQPTNALITTDQRGDSAAISVPKTP